MDHFYKKRATTVIGFICLITLSSCASYNAYALSNLSSSIIVHQNRGEEKISVRGVAKPFNKSDCIKYLDRDVISAGYMPVQIYIENNSSTAYIFDTERLSLCCAHVEEVARKVHTSTLGRIAVYSAGALVIGPLLIPAIVDGIKSADANKALDVDFLIKSAQNQTLQPYSHINKIIFVPVEAYHPNLSVTLIDTNTGFPETVQLSGM